MKETEKYLECAVIVNTHGINGAMKLENRCDTPQVLASLPAMYIKKDDGFERLSVLHSSVQKNMILTTFDGICTVEAAQAMRNTVLYADRDDFHLKKGDFFIADLIGLPVIDAENGSKYGILEDVIMPGAQQIYVVRDKSETFMIPAVPEFIRDISLDEEKGCGIFVSLIDGMRDSKV